MRAEWDKRTKRWWSASNEIFDRPGLSADARLVYCALCRANDFDHRPSHQELAEMTSLSVQAVRHGLDQLVAEGFVTDGIVRDDGCFPNRGEEVGR